MAYLRIHCEKCGQMWEVYERAMNDELSRVCPHCESEIERQTWKNQIVPSLCQVSDSNRELMKDHLGYKDTLFSFDVINNLHKGRKQK